MSNETNLEGEWKTFDIVHSNISKCVNSGEAMLRSLSEKHD